VLKIAVNDLQFSALTVGSSCNDPEMR